MAALLVFLYSNVLIVPANCLVPLPLSVAPLFVQTCIIWKLCSNEYHTTFILENVTIPWSLFTYSDIESISSHYISVSSYYIHPLVFVIISTLFVIPPLFSCSNRPKLTELWPNYRLKL